MAYAQNTSTSVESSKIEVERLVTKYGAGGFMAGWLGGRAMVAFEMHDRRLRFVLPLPARDDRAFTHTKATGGRRALARSAASALSHWEQACRARWRALVLIIKAKLEAVASGVATFDEEMLPYMVCQDGLTIAEKMVPQLPQITSTGNLPPLLGGPSAANR